MKFFTSFCLTFFIAFSSNAEDLVEIYKLAKINDPTLQSAYHQHKASLEALPQAVAGLLPTLSASANHKSFDSTDPVFARYNTWGYQLTLSQPLLNFGSWSDLAQAKDRVKAAVATLADAEQSLLIRVATQYFAILGSQDDLDFIRSERKAFNRHLEQTQQRFDVGIIAITDVHEAQARRDNAYAQEIAAENFLANEKEKLREIVGKSIQQLPPLKTNNLILPPPNPANIDKWVNMANEQNWSLQSGRYTLNVTRELVNKERTNNYPIVSLDANILRSKASPPSPLKSTSKDAGINISVPLFSGGSIFSKTKAANESYEQALHNLEQVRRTTETTTRNSYRNVITNINKVKALEQTLVSSRSALKATKSAFEVGTRTIVDVLNAQSDVLDAERRLYKSHYEYILESLRLKYAAGIVSVEDLVELNLWLSGGKRHNLPRPPKDVKPVKSVDHIMPHKHPATKGDDYIPSPSSKPRAIKTDTIKIKTQPEKPVEIKPQPKDDLSIKKQLPASEDIPSPGITHKKLKQTPIAPKTENIHTPKPKIQHSENIPKPASINLPTTYRP